MAEFDWKLLNQQVMEDFKTINPQINVLDTNWRSDKTLFVNMAFVIANQLAIRLMTQRSQSVETIRQIYSDEVKQKYPQTLKRAMCRCRL